MLKNILEEVLDDDHRRNDVGYNCHTEYDINRARKLGMVGLELHRRKYLVTTNVIMMLMMTRAISTACPILGDLTIPFLMSH